MYRTVIVDSSISVLDFLPACKWKRFCEAEYLSQASSANYSQSLAYFEVAGLLLVSSGLHCRNEASKQKSRMHRKSAKQLHGQSRLGHCGKKYDSTSFKNACCRELLVDINVFKKERKTCINDAIYCNHSQKQRTPHAG